jgi:hypothetical protein
MKNSKLFFYSHFAVIASCAFLISVKLTMPEAISDADLVFLVALESFAIFLLFKMHDMAKKEKEQTNNNNEVSQ